MGLRVLRCAGLLASLSGGACGAEPLFIDVASLPAETNWVAVLVEDASDRLLGSFGLTPVADVALVLEAEALAESDHVTLQAYRRTDLEGLVRNFEPETLAAPLRGAAPTEPALPRSVWQARLGAAGGELEPDHRRRELTSDALLPCSDPEPGTRSGLIQISCAEAPCVPGATQIGCQLEVDFGTECGAEVLSGRLAPDGGFSIPDEDGWFGRCSPIAPREGASFELQCERAEGQACFVEGAPLGDHAPVEWEVRKILPEAPEVVDDQFPLLANGVWPAEEGVLALFTPGRELCSEPVPRRLLFLSRSTLELTRSATVADCIAHVVAVPGGRGFWAATVSPLAILRLDASGRLIARQPIQAESVSARGLPFSFDYDPVSGLLVTVLAEIDRESRRSVEYQVFDAETLELRASHVYPQQSRMEKAAVAWGRLFALDDDQDRLRILELATLREERVIQLYGEHQRRNYASLTYLPVLDELVIRVSGRFRAALTISENGDMSRIFNFETTLHPYTAASLPAANGAHLLVAFGEPIAPSYGLFAVIDRGRSRYLPGLSRFEGDYPDVSYSDEEDEFAYVLLRRSARVMRVRMTAP